MKLSEAIREGSKIRPQGYDFFQVWKGKLRSCALGAALEGAKLVRKPRGDESQMEMILLLYKTWPELDRQDVIFNCPADCKEKASLEGLIFRLSDHHKWTREQIADWVKEKGY